MDIGQRIKAKRTKLGITQEELAAKLNVTYQAVSNWEQDKSLPGIDNLPRLSAALDESIDYLLTGEEFKKKAQSEKDEVVAYFESRIAPYKLTKPAIEKLKQETASYPVDRIKQSIDITCERLGQSPDEISEKQIYNMISYMRGVLYRRSLPQIQQEINRMVSFLAKRDGTYDKQSKNDLSQSIEVLLGWRMAESGDAAVPIDVLNRINEDYLVRTKSLKEAYYDIQREIKAYQRKAAKRQKLIAFAKRINGGYLRIDVDCPAEIKDAVGAANDAILKGGEVLANRLLDLLSVLVFDLLSFVKTKDIRIIETSKTKDLHSIATYLYEYLGRDLGKDNFRNINETIAFLDDAEAVEKALKSIVRESYNFLDRFNYLLNCLLKKRLHLSKKAVC